MSPKVRRKRILSLPGHFAFPDTEFHSKPFLGRGYPGCAGVAKLVIRA
jgi:hypothetical protein